MSVSAVDFWKLLSESNLLHPAQYEQLRSEFRKLKGAEQLSEGKPVAKWLLARGSISKYQAKVLLAGRTGPLVCGDYRIEDKLTNDRLTNQRFADFFQATHLPTTKKVAVRFVSGSITRDPAAMAIVEQNVRHAQSFSSPHVSKCIDLASAGGFTFLVTEEPLGQTLKQRLAVTKQLPDFEVLEIARDLAKALTEMHAAGIVHGDIRPENIVVRAGGAAVLLQYPYSRDLGIANSTPVLKSGEARVNAAASYFAPELLAPQSPPTTAVDVYALGCTLYECLSGTPLFTECELKEKLLKHKQEMPNIAALQVRPELQDLLRNMLVKDPAARPTAESALAAVRELLHFPGNELPSVAPAVAVDDLDELSSIAVDDPIRSGAPSEKLPSIAVDDASPRIRRAAHSTTRSRKSKVPTWTLPVAACATLMIMGIAVAYSSGILGSSSDDDVASNSVVADLAAQAPLSNVVVGEPADAPFIPVADDGKTLWAEPVPAAPIDRHYIVPGTQVLIIVRPADLLNQPGGKELMAALGPMGAEGQNQLVKTSGLELAEIQQLKVCLYTSEADELGTALIVHPIESITRDTLLSQWGNPAPTKHGDSEYYSRGQNNYAFPSASETTFVVGETTAVQEVLDGADAPTVMRREIENLLSTSDHDRHFTVAFAPSFVFTDGRSLFSGPLAQLKDPLQEFLGEKLKAGILSAHLSPETFFVELRTIGTVDQQPTALSQQYLAKLRNASEEVKEYILSRAIHPYARKLLFDLPQMVQYLGDNARAGSENGQAIVRCYLPAPAGENLILASELALAQTPGETLATTAASVVSANTDANAAEQALQRNASLAFDRNTLEESMRLLSQEIGIPIEIAGADLQLDGITKNQSFNLNERDQPASEILRKVLLKANPDGKLVYIVRPGPSGDVIYITTRGAAAKRGDKLPPEFETP